MTYPTQQRLHELFRYDASTGELLRRDGTARGSLGGDGRYRCRVDGKSFLRSRLVWLYCTGQMPLQQIDHKDQDRANDRLENLRDVSPAVNSQNQIPTGAGMSGYRGVTKRGNRFKAVIEANGQRIYLGYFADAKNASAAYQAAKRVYHV